MYNIKSGTRMVQTLKNKKDKVFTLYNNSINKSIEINYMGARLLRLIKNKSLKIENLLGLSFIQELIQLNFITNEENSNVMLSKKCHYKYPLTSISLELTNQCNLNCVHCYGSYGANVKGCFLPFDWIKNNLSEFNKLNVLKIALTGGESTLHPDFLKIVDFILSNGFELCVFTNGFNTNIIKQMLKNTKQYHYVVKVSCDGPEQIHNKIRRSPYSFFRVIETLDILKKYPNITTYISTAVMPANIDYISDFKKYIKRNYPNFIHTLDLVFPSGNGKDNYFSLQELKNVKKQIPELFNYSEGNHSRFRCSGGVNQCTISPDGTMKICNAACADAFAFKSNVFDLSLRKAWLHGGKNISYFRKEKFKNTKDCVNCKIRSICKMNDCRVMAYFYKGDIHCSNPITCISAQNYFKQS